MSFAILILTAVTELALFYAYTIKPSPWANAYRRPYVSIKTRHLVNMDRISTNRY